MKFCLIAVAALICVALSGCKEELHGYVALEQTNEPVMMKFTNEEEPGSKNNYVSIAPLGNEKYLLANYADLILLDRKKESLCKVRIKDNAGITIESKNGDVTVLNPTGVHAEPDGRVFVANYKANNILMGRIAADGCSFVVDFKFSSSETNGPENVFVHREDGLLLSANYDSGTIVAFKIDTGEQVWVASVPQAHGVTVSEGKVYATGLSERKIYEFELKTGKIIRSKGSVGWNPMAAQYMWPTSIYPFDSGSLVVSDPQSGYISILDKKTLDVQHYTGGNGPADNLLNYPYAAVPDGDELIVLSSMRGSILFIDKENMQVIQKLNFIKENWPNSSGTLPLFGVGWDKYVDKSSFSIKLAGSDYRLGFGNLHPVKSGPVFKAPNISSLFNPGAYIYFMQGYSAGNVGIMFSSSSTTMLATVSKLGNPDVLLPKLIGIDSWKVDNRLVSGSRNEQLLDDVVTQAQGVADAYYVYLDKMGWVDAENLYSLLNFISMGLDYNTYLTRLDQVFRSPAGREFKLVYDLCNAEACGKQALSNAARRYYREVAGYNQVEMDEFYLVGMVSGVSTKPSTEVSVLYDDCDIGSYYAGYGLQALMTPDLDDYLSAVDFAHSSVCLTVKGHGVARGFDVVWNDVATAPKSIEIYESSTADNSSWKFVEKFNNIKVKTINGYAVSSLSFGKMGGYSRLKLKVTDGGSKNRLIMRQINLDIEKNSETNNDLKGPFELMACPNTSNYVGHGVDALITSTLNDYFSSINIEQSSICFSNLSRHNLLGISVGWYSAAEVGELVEVFGSNFKDFKSETSIGEYPFLPTRNLSGFLFSDIYTKDESNYPYYRVKLLRGKGQNRFILRSFIPLTSSKVVGGDEEIQRIATEVSAEFDYGKGVSKIASQSNRSLADIEKLISSSDDAHCGNYALVFVNRLPKNAEWRVFDLSTRDGRVHSVVEVKRNNRSFVYDPTLGVEYRCSLDAMIGGKCSYSNDLSYYRVNPALQVFRGAGFFYGAQINRIYSSDEDLLSAYF